MMKRTKILATLGVGGVLLISFSGAVPVREAMTGPFSFAVTADMREYAGPGLYDTSSYFRGTCEAIAALGGGAFMVSPGDIDPPGDVSWTIEQYIGPGAVWYPVVGNHEKETPSDMDWLRAYNEYGDTLPNIVNVGPPGCEETTYSFNYENAHFVVLNEYYDGVSDTGTTGDVADALYAWLVDDLNGTDREHIFVFGHEPAFPQPDVDTGRARHVGDSLDLYKTNRDRFWTLLRDRGVLAYICGHTHNYSAVKIDGVWQLDAGHCRGYGDLGAPSTFIMIHVNGGDVSFETYRDDHDGLYDYGDIIYSGSLASSAYEEVTYTFQDGAFPSPGYEGTRDTKIRSDLPGTAFGSAANLEVDGSPAKAAIIAWDVGSIPPGTTVTYASITLTVTNHSLDQAYELYEMKRDWAEPESTWTQYSVGNPWGTPGADGADDRGQTPLGAIATSYPGQFTYNLNADGIALVQSWVNNPSANHGLVILDYLEGIDGIDFDSREAITAEWRPKLTVEAVRPAGSCFIGVACR